MSCAGNPNVKLFISYEKGGNVMKILFFLAAMLLATGLMVPSVLMANMALELDGDSAIEVPDSDSLNPTTAITIEAWMKMEKDNGECLAKDWGGQRDYIFPVPFI